ncbi:MAG: hypothetical protein LBR23_00335 [Spirochaetaceae bacterium]|jgi:hypothetical protein|nr:hypothetical protein [Spirochaetaceae bacterium]
MKNPKIIIIAGAAGFFLSFIIALASGAGLGIVLLRALVCALAAGALTLGIQAAAGRYLSVPGEGAFFPQEGEASQAGRGVNILLGDDPLPGDRNGPEFDVTGIQGEFSFTPQGERAPQTLFPDLDTAGSPGSSGKPPKEPPGTGSPPDPAFRVEAPPSGDGPGIETAADLPEFGQFAVPGLSGEDRIRDAAPPLTTGEAVEFRPEKKAVSIDVSDTQALASAIRTLVAKG